MDEAGIGITIHGGGKWVWDPTISLNVFSFA